MAETITNRKCPECGSFVQAKLKKCTVCGFEADKVQNQAPPRSNETKPALENCPKCQRQCALGAQFCNHCGAALGQGKSRSTKIYSQEESVLTSGSDRNRKHRFIRFNWIKMTPGYTMLNSLDLDPDIALFDGYVQWEGYGFFIYQNRKKQEILIRKTDPLVAAGPQLPFWFALIYVTSSSLAFVATISVSA